MSRNITRLDQLTALAMLLIAFCFLAFGPVWGWRSGGVVFTIQGVIVCFTRSLPAGLEAPPPPRFYLRGAPAVIAGLLIIIGGALIVSYASFLAE